MSIALPMIDCPMFLGEGHLSVMSPMAWALRLLVTSSDGDLIRELARYGLQGLIETKVAASIATTASTLAPASATIPP